MLKHLYPISDNNQVDHTIHYEARKKKKIISCSIEEFEKKTSIHYLSQLRFLNQETYEKVKSLTERSVTEKAARMGIIYEQDILQKQVADVYIRWINSRLGFGLFAAKNMKAGTYIGEYTGIVRPCNYFFSDVNEYCFHYPIQHHGLRLFTIDAEDYCNETSFINHSDRPNCEALSMYCNHLLHICMRTFRSVDKGEQLTYDYGNKFWGISTLEIN